MTGDAILSFLKSQPFILYVAIFSVIWLAPNTYYVYYSFSIFQSPYRELSSAGVSLIVASGIMIYTLRGNDKVANYYCWFEISISMYYYVMTIGWDWGLIPAFSFCFMLPASVKYYTKELQENKQTLQFKYDTLEREFKNVASLYKKNYPNNTIDFNINESSSAQMLESLNIDLSDKSPEALKIYEKFFPKQPENEGPSDSWNTRNPL